MDRGYRNAMFWGWMIWVLEYCYKDVWRVWGLDEIEFRVYVWIIWHFDIDLWNIFKSLMFDNTIKD